MRQNKILVTTLKPNIKKVFLRVLFGITMDKYLIFFSKLHTTPLQKMIN